MDDISVGEYVRTKNGIIDKVINPNFYINIYIECEKDLITKSKIKKHSPNIIDLIEVGDILEILCNEISKETNTIRIKDIEQLKVIKQIPKFIKSVTTKEQFKSVSYEV